MKWKTTLISLNLISFRRLKYSGNEQIKMREQIPFKKARRTSSNIKTDMNNSVIYEKFSNFSSAAFGSLRGLPGSWTVSRSTKTENMAGYFRFVFVNSPANIEFSLSTISERYASDKLRGKKLPDRVSDFIPNSEYVQVSFASSVKTTKYSD